MCSAVGAVYDRAQSLNMIELLNIEKAYEVRAAKTFVLRRITLSIKEGEFVTIMGPSGAGKSSLLSILGMLDAVWTGEYHFLNEAIHKLKPRDRMEINKAYMLTQDSPAPKTMEYSAVKFGTAKGADHHMHH